MIIGVAGPPGIGKSTLIKHLAQATGSVASFEDPADYPLVHHVGGKSKDWQFLNQLSFQVRKMEMSILSTQSDQIVEFDWYSSHKYWTQASVSAGLIESRHGDLLEEIVRIAVAVGVPRPDVFIELTARTELVLERLRARGRDYEQTESMARLVAEINQQRLDGSSQPVIGIQADRAPDELAQEALTKLAAVRSDLERSGRGGVGRW